MKTTPTEYDVLHKAYRKLNADPNTKVADKAILHNYLERVRVETMTERQRKVIEAG